MPTYVYQHPETEEVREVLQKMTDPHEYEVEGIKWERVWVSPNAAINDGLINADTSCEDFVRKTKDKNYNLGEMWDLSSQLSEKRKRVAGVDHVKETTKKAYTKRCKGKKHPHGD
jgi:uncharacterized protein YeeX (DUF496 family)